MILTGVSSNIELSNKSIKPLSAALIMICIYIFLFIERPWESIRYLNGYPIERVFAIAMIIIAFMAGRFKVVASPTNKWIYGLLTLHFIMAPCAYNSGYAIDQSIEYAKMVLLYLLMVSVADDEESLKLLVKVYVFSMMFYVMHSLWEYHNGRHDFKMGIRRMLGVDNTFNDPNAFGASVVLSLPFAYALIRSEASNLLRNSLYIYFVLALVCVVLTGSRSAFIAYLSLIFLWAALQKGIRKIRMIAVMIVTIAVVWLVMPLEKQDRIRTLWDKDVGTAGAHMSAEGRIIGWNVSWKMFKLEPLTGVGAGGRNFVAYRMDNKIDEPGQESPLEAHVLYGEVLAELGAFGAILLGGLIVSVCRCCLLARNYIKSQKVIDEFLFVLSGAILASLLLLLLFGFAGHNFYRPLWLWLAAWAGSLYTIVRKTNSTCDV